MKDKGKMNKLIKRSICLIMTVVMLFCSAAVPSSAFAAETETYRYVAIGDSIAAGYGLSGTPLDPAFFLTDELIANPVRTAYPAVFGELLAGLGEEKGVKAETFNLATSGYQAQNIVQALKVEGYVNETYAAFMGQMFGEERAREVLTRYHDILVGYLKEADLVSVHLGGNDMIYGAFDVMAEKQNPLMEIISTAAYMVLLGTDMNTILGTIRASLDAQGDSLSLQTYLEAATIFGSLVTGMDDLVEKAADEVNEVIEAVQSINGRADIAVVGMYNPYGNSLEYEGKVRNLRAIVTAAFWDAADILIERLGGKKAEASESLSGEAPASEGDTGADPQKVSQRISEAIKKLKALAVKLVKNISSSSSPILEDVRKLLYAIAEEVSYPLQYLFLGKSIEPMMKLLNEKLAKSADAAGGTFVDIYDISNKKDYDPHPTAKGHEEIAEILFDTMSGKAGEGMTKKVEQPTLNKASASLYVGKTVQLKASTEVTWKSSDTKVAAVSADGLVTAKGIGKATISAAAKNGRTASCKVTVSCKYVWQCVKNGVYRYTVDTDAVKSMKNSGWSCKKMFRAPGASGQKVYWICDKTTKRYQYTTNLAYAKKMKAAGHKAGLAFYSSAKKTVPVYEYRKNAAKVTYRYAFTAADRKSLKAAGWTENGIAWYAEPKTV